MLSVVGQLPAGGEIVIFDRSWYNRGAVLSVMGFVTRKSTDSFRDCPFEGFGQWASPLPKCKLRNQKRHKRFLSVFKTISLEA
jgi:hypothetical protein